jgi:hypothetical protein
MSLSEHKQKEVLDNFIFELENALKKNKIFGSSADFISKKICTYSSEFLERLRHYGRTELNEPLRLTNWVEEYILCIADLRLYQVSTTGNAQCGKTLFNTLYLIDFTAFSNLDTIWFYPTKTQLDSLVPAMYGRVSKYYLSNLEKSLDLISLAPKGNNYAQKLRDATIYFRFASTSAKDTTEAKKGLAAVGGSAASISGNVLFIEERSQIAPESLSTLYRRLDAARFPNGLIREIGTPGGGLGIESNIDRADHHFYPHTTCLSCGKEIALNPKGALLHKQPDGKYLSRTGRPVTWFHSDPHKKIKSAYFGCEYCRHPISDQQRKDAFFKCLKTGKRLTKLLEELPTSEDEIFKQQMNVVVHLSPLLRQSKLNLASLLIDIGENGDNPRDFQQQVLGWRSENDQSSITRELLKTAMDIYPPEKPHTCIIAGIDQGRHEDWLVIYKVWIEGFKRLPDIREWIYYPSQNRSPIARLEDSKKEVIFMSAVNRADIPRLLNEYNVDFGFIDNEPDIPDAYEFSQSTVLECADQKENLAKVVSPYQIMGGSMAIDGFAINTEYFKDLVLSSYVNQNVCLLEIDLNDKTVRSPCRHLTSSEKDLDKNKWIRPSDHIDDLFLASTFCEAALHEWANRIVELTSNSIQWFVDIHEDHFL